jgi:hypothetical protein
MSVIGPVQRPESFHDTVSKSTSEGLLLGLGSEVSALIPARFAASASKYFGAIGEALLGEQRMARMALDRELRAAPQFWEIPAEAATYEAKAGVWAGNGSKVSTGKSVAPAVTPKPTTAKPPASPNYSAPSTIETIASAANAKRVVPAEITYDFGSISNSSAALDSSSLLNGIGSNGTAAYRDAKTGAALVREGHSGIDSVVNEVNGAINSEHLSLVTSHPDAHALARHGGAVTDGQLFTRAQTGVAPDGSVSIKNGQVRLPELATAFNSDLLLIEADQFVRNNQLRAAIASDPSKLVHTIKGADVGQIVGRGFERVGGGAYRPTTQGPLNFIDGLSKVQGTYEYNVVTGQWQTITIFPVR